MSSPHDSITLIDCHYHGEPETAAAYLVIENGRAAFIDNNANPAIPRLLAALADRGLGPEAVDYAIITHVHLTAGGTAERRHRPNAIAVAHPKAARHLIDPARLIAAPAVYGANSTTRWPRDRSHYGSGPTVEDGEQIEWVHTPTFLDTRGHASHHCCIHDSRENIIFAGDTFGLGRMSSRRPGPPFIVCTSSPPEFDPAEARKSVQRILDTGADWAYITHFGMFDELPARAAQLLDSIDRLEDVARGVRHGSGGHALHAFCAERVRAVFTAHLENAGYPIPPPTCTGCAATRNSTPWPAITLRLAEGLVRGRAGMVLLHAWWIAQAAPRRTATGRCAWRRHTACSPRHRRHVRVAHMPSTVHQARSTRMARVTNSRSGSRSRERASLSPRSSSQPFFMPNNLANRMASTAPNTTRKKVLPVVQLAARRGMNRITGC